MIKAWCEQVKNWSNQLNELNHRNIEMCNIFRFWIAAMKDIVLFYRNSMIEKGK